MTALLYFAVWAGLIFLMMRFGCGSHVMGHHHAGQTTDGGKPPGTAGAAQWTPPSTDIDPVCRVSVATDGTKSSIYHGTVYYFCSAEHRNAFEAAPERYVGTLARTAEKPLEPDHHD